MNWGTLAALISAVAALISALSYCAYGPENASQSSQPPPIQSTPSTTYPPETNYPDTYTPDTYAPSTLYCCDAWGNQRCVIAYNTGPIGSLCTCPYQGNGFICQ